MKKLFVCALAASMFTACSQDETISQQSPMQISFANAFVNNATRAVTATDPSTTDESLTAFDVWGFMNNPSGVIFEGEDVTGSKGNFSYVNTQYWVANNTYYFAALAPMNMDESVLKINVNKGADADMYGLGTIIYSMQNEEQDGSTDLLYAATVRELGEEIDDSPVKFEFKHLLSKVKFTFKNGFTNPNTMVKVLNVQMKAPYGPGTINLNQQNWWSTNQWILQRPESQSKFFKFGDAGEIAYGSEQESADERLLFPTSVANEVNPESSFNGYVVTFTAELYNGEVLAGTYEHSIELKGVDFVIGHAYDLVAELNSTNIDPSGESLKPIVFDVQEVKKWDTGVAAGVGANVANEAELRAAVNNGGNVILAADIEFTDYLHIKKNVTLNLNGKTLKGGKEDNDDMSGSDISAIVVDEDATLTIIGEGTIEGTEYGVYAKKGNVNVKSGNIVAGTSAIQVYKGIATIEGGNFSNTDDDKRYVINCIDACWKSGEAVVSIKGGTFEGFNPDKSHSENPAAKFLAEGYKSVETETGIWEVIAE